MHKKHKKHLDSSSNSVFVSSCKSKSSSMNSTNSGCTTIDLSESEYECDQDNDLEKILDMIKVLNKGVCALKSENMKHHKKISHVCKRVERLECDEQQSSSVAGCLEDPIKNYIDHQIDKKFEHLMEVLECKFKKIEESMDNLQRVVYNKGCSR